MLQPVDQLRPLLTALAFALSAGIACAAGTPRGKVDERGFVQIDTKKSGSGVRVAYRIDGEPQPGVPATMTVEFRGINAPAGAIASFGTEEPAVLTGPSTLKLKPGPPQSATVALTAAQDGIYFVNVTTTQAGRSSVVSIPVKVGAGGRRLERPGTVEITPSGERVISLPPKPER